MKKLLIFIGCILFIGCVQQQNQNQTANETMETTAQATPQPTEEIALVSIPENANGKISTEKNIYIVFDGSGSMDDYCSGDRKIDIAKQAAREYVEKIPNDVNTGLYVFDNRGQGEVVAIGKNNKGSLIAAINAIRHNSGTPLVHSIRVGTDKLFERRTYQLGYGEFRLVILTDGEATDEGYSEGNLDDATRYATEHGVAIYTIGLCLEGGHALRKYAVSYKAADDFESLKKGLEETLSESSTFDDTQFEVVKK
ncbi:MAG: VWA domain-containing protein [Parcubacteria group bacterium]|nr:VWA domain-containing protein [Parcubacteria group bacterium]